MSETVKKWIRGLIGAIINSVASSLTVAIVDPQSFNPFGEGSLAKLGAVCVVSSIFGAALYLKQHPVPGEEFDPRRFVLR